MVAKPFTAFRRFSRVNLTGNCPSFALASPVIAKPNHADIFWA